MRSPLHKLRIGDQIWVEVIERTPDSFYIVSYRGDLVRVRNESFQALIEDQKLLVRVAAVSPLQFQIVNTNGDRRNANRIDVSV
jgi:hypothetical protein